MVTEDIQTQYMVMINLLELNANAFEDLVRVYNELWKDSVDAINYVGIFETVAVFHMTQLLPVMSAFDVFVEDEELDLDYSHAAAQWGRRAEILSQAMLKLDSAEGIERQGYAALASKTVKIWKEQPLLIEDWKQGIEDIIEIKEYDAFTDETE